MLDSAHKRRRRRSSKQQLQQRLRSLQLDLRESSLCVGHVYGPVAACFSRRLQTKISRFDISDFGTNFEADFNRLVEISCD